MLNGNSSLKRKILAPFEKYASNYTLAIANWVYTLICGLHNTLA